MAGVDADTGVVHGHRDLIALGGPRSDRQLPRPVADACHGLDPVHDEIEDDLLQLNPIAEHGRQRGRKVDSQRHAVVA